MSKKIANKEYMREKLQEVAELLEHVNNEVTILSGVANGWYEVARNDEGEWMVRLTDEGKEIGNALEAQRAEKEGAVTGGLAKQS